MAVLMARMLGKPVLPTRLSDVPEGSVIYLEETVDGVITAVPYVVAKHNYEPEYNSNRTMLVRNYSDGTTSVWGSAYTEEWPDCTLFTTLQAYLSRFSEKVQAAIGETYYAYSDSTLDEPVGYMASAIFSPSINELIEAGYTYANVEGSYIAALSGIVDYFDEGGTNRAYRTRSRYTSPSSSYASCGVSTAAAATRVKHSTASYMMVALSLPGDTILDPGTMTPKEDFL